MDILNEIYDDQNKEDTTKKSEKIENELIVEKSTSKISDEESGVESNSDSESGENDSKDKESSKFSRNKLKKKSKVISEKSVKNDADSQNEEQKPHEDSSNKNRTESIKGSDGPNIINNTLKCSLSIPQKTQSIFFKHLPVNVTRQDLEEVIALTCDYL